MNFVILLAGGNGQRIKNFVRDKCLESINYKPVFFHSLNSFIKTKNFQKYIIVFNSESQKVFIRDFLNKELGSKFKEYDLVKGGNARCSSVRNALLHLNKTYKISDKCMVAIHDAARPLIKTSFINRLLELALNYGNAVPASKINDSIKYVKDYKSYYKEDKPLSLNKNLCKDQVRAVQTPQIFKVKEITECYNYKNNLTNDVSDDSYTLINCGKDVFIIDNPEPNPKITFKIDIDYINYLLNKNLV